MIQAEGKVLCGLDPELELSLGAPQVTGNVERAAELPGEQVAVTSVGNPSGAKGLVALMIEG